MNIYRNDGKLVCYPIYSKPETSRGLRSKYMLFSKEYEPLTKSVHQDQIISYRKNTELLFSKYAQGEIYTPYLVPIVLDSQKIYNEAGSGSIDINTLNTIRETS